MIIRRMVVLSIAGSNVHYKSLHSTARPQLLIKDDFPRLATKISASAYVGGPMRDLSGRPGSGALPGLAPIPDLPMRLCESAGVIAAFFSRKYGYDVFAQNPME